MSARSGLIQIAKDAGWTVADNGRFASFNRGDRFVQVTWSVRGSVTTARKFRAGEPGRSAVGAGKFDWIREELMRNA